MKSTEERIAEARRRAELSPLKFFLSTSLDNAAVNFQTSSNVSGANRMETTEEKGSTVPTSGSKQTPF